MIDYEDHISEELGFITVLTPKEISTYRNSVLLSANNLNSDYLRERSTIAIEIFEAWQAWYNDFLKYVKNSGYFSDLWAGSMREVELKAKELEDFRSIFTSFSGKNPTGPKIHIAEVSSTTPLFDGLKWVALPIIGYFIWDIFRKK